LDSHVDILPKKDKLYIGEKSPILTKSDIPVKVSTLSPPVVKDPTKSYIWSAKNGIKENIK